MFSDIRVYEGRWNLGSGSIYVSKVGKANNPLLDL